MRRLDQRAAIDRVEVGNRIFRIEPADAPVGTGRDGKFAITPIDQVLALGPRTPDAGWCSGPDGRRLSWVVDRQHRLGSGDMAP